MVTEIFIAIITLVKSLAKLVIALLISKKIEKGFIGNLYGWDICVSNDLARNDDGTIYPLFGLKNKTLAGGVTKDLNMQHYIPEKNFDTNYKGYALYGVGAPRADFLGAVIDS